MKKGISCLLLLALVIGAIPARPLPVTAEGIAGNHEAEFMAPITRVEELADAAEYITISNRAELEAVNENPSGKYCLLNDIDLSDAPWEPIGGVSPFTGTFDGQGWVITGMHVGGKVNAGLFGRVQSGKVKNTGIADSSLVVSHSGYGGGLIGRVNDAAEVSNCFSEVVISCAGDATRACTGGLIGYARGAMGSGSHGKLTIGYCYNKGDILGRGEIGGIVGSVYGFDNVSISDSYNEGQLFGGASQVFAGGICGYIDETNASFTRLYNTGNVTAQGNEENATADAGGIVGSGGSVKLKTISECYNTGIVSATARTVWAGGILGSSFYASFTVTNCYNKGDVSGSSESRKKNARSSCYAGGIAGSATGVENCYNNAGVTANAAFEAEWTYTDSSACIAAASGIVAENRTQTKNCVVIGSEISAMSDDVYNSFVFTNLDSTKTINNYTDLDPDGFSDVIFQWITDQGFRLQATVVSLLGWDFGEIWKMPAKSGYPVLKKIEEAKRAGSSPAEKITLKYSDGEVDVNWGGESFSKPSYIYNKDLALTAAVLSDSAYNQSWLLHDAPDSNYKKLGFSNDVYYNYDEVYAEVLPGSEADEHCFSFASRTMFINGQEELVAAVVFRGTGNLFVEGKGDVADTKLVDFYDYRAYHYFKSFFDKVNAEFVKYINGISEEYRAVNVLISGHSLGGAAANLFAGAFHLDPVLKQIAPRTHVYAFTFGALNSIDQKNMIADYPYIFNVFNYYDAFGTHGIWAGSASMFADGTKTVRQKFGNIKYCLTDYNNDVFLPDHAMSNYVKTTLDNVLLTNPSAAVVACPVDVEVYRGPTLVGKVVNNVVDAAKTSIPIYVYDEAKYILLPDNREAYSIRIKATDNGTMSYLIEDFDETTGGSTMEYQEIALTAGKQFLSETGAAVVVPETKIYVVDDQDNKIKEIQSDGTETPMQDEMLLGDPTADGLRNIFDILALRDHIFGKRILTDAARTAADVNGDSEVNLFDVIAIRDHIFGKKLIS